MSAVHQSNFTNLDLAESTLLALAHRQWWLALEKNINQIEVTILGILADKSDTTARVLHFRRAWAAEEPDGSPVMKLSVAISTRLTKH